MRPRAAIRLRSESAMAPVAYGYMILLAAAAVTGIFVGTLGGAVAWNLRANWAIGLAVAFVACVLILLAEGARTFLPGQLMFAGAPLLLTYLCSFAVARILVENRGLDRVRTTIIALGVALTVGVLVELLFR